MNIKLIAIGNKMPAWVNSGFNEYAKRLPPDYRLQLIEIPALKRTKNTVAEQVMKAETEKLLAASTNPIIALDRQGKIVSTEKLAEQLQSWHDHHQSPSLLVGGPEGLSAAGQKLADDTWSLSALTFPHPLVRIILAEQIYRAWSILSHHPYHRS
ncbi:MAG TPA: 23S rRNA (pseudouridine(1915)-N(3))-methyltransferase RlmH [Nitrosomonas sp.]|nr:23S rRNA (pseudouridine(1915)-N(3))-methyltransferase RlmH [Nitrosomonas sp.]